MDIKIMYKAKTFMYKNARLLDRRRFEYFLKEVVRKLSYLRLQLIRIQMEGLETHLSPIFVVRKANRLQQRSPFS